MIYLLLSVVFSTSLFVIFKYFEIFKVDTLKAIVVNYIVAFSIGFLTTDSTISFGDLFQQDWIYGAVALGLMFVSIFFVMALTAQRNGVSVVSVAGKMSVVIPILFGIFLYNESVVFLKIVGILIALVAVYLASVKEEKTENNNASIVFPIILFLGSGAIDTTLKYVEVNFVPQNDVAIFSGSLFGFAAFFGLIILLFKALKKRTSFGLKNVIAGVILGVPNYYSIFFLIKALQVKGFDSSTLFTINNIGIVVVSTLVGLFLFKEQFSLKNKIGVVLAIVGIVLVTLA